LQLVIIYKQSAFRYRRSRSFANSEKYFSPQISLSIKEKYFSRTWSKTTEGRERRFLGYIFVIII